MILHAEAYIPIIAAAAANVVVETIWHSDMLFGSMWKKVGGKVPAQKDLYSKMAMHATASLFMAMALFITISIFQKAHNLNDQGVFYKFFSLFIQENVQNNSLMASLKTAAFLWLGFIMPTKAMHTIWGSENWFKFMIATTGQLAGILAMAATIAYL